MSKLKQDFPGFAELDAEGEATTAKVRKRIQDGTLQEIPGIGPAGEEKIIEAFENLDTPSEQADDMKEIEDDEDITPASQHAERTAKAEKNADAGTLVNKGGGPDDAAIDAGEKEAKKTGAEKNALPGHALDELSPTERRQAGVNESTAERLAHSGAVYVYDPAGEYASRTAVRIPQGHIRIKVDPIAFVSPRKGMIVKDGEDEYAVQEDLGLDSRPDDWLKVRSPNTGEPFIR